MSMEARKLELIEWITGLESPEMVNNLLFLKQNQTGTDWWNAISDAERQKIKQGLKDHEEGNVITAEDLWAKYGK